MRIVIIVLTILWFLIGARISKKTFCGDSTNLSEATSGVLGVSGDDCISTLVFRDKNGGLELNSKENFQFVKSSADVMGTTSEMAATLEALIKYLNSNSDRFMEITGLYHESEENATDKDNLGKARALSVRSYLISKGIEGKQLTTKGAMDNTLCTNEEKILRGVKVAFSKIPKQ